MFKIKSRVEGSNPMELCRDIPQYDSIMENFHKWT